MPCIICGNDETKKLYDVLLECKECSFIQADLNVTEEELKGIYGKNYFFGEEYADYLKEEEALRKNFQRNLKLVSKYCPSGRLLEIGSAYGFFLDTARSQYQVEGIEINPDACNYAKERFGLDVVCGDFLQQPFAKGRYDIIVMWATIEHLKDPDLYVKKASELLKPGGIFVCTAPDIGSALAKAQKRRWRQIHPPTHINYFSKETLEKLLNKHQLQLVKVTWPGEFRTFNQALYIILVLRNKLGKLYAFLDKLRITRGIFYLNTFDQICMVARKT